MVQNTLLVYIALVAMFVIGMIGGGAVVFFLRRMVINRQLRAAQRKAAKMVADGRDEAKNIINEAKVETEKIRAAAETEQRERRVEIQRQENRLSSKLENLEH